MRWPIEAELHEKIGAPLAKKVRGLSPLFIATVIVPTFLAVLYFGLLSSDIYISDSKFVVRSPEKPAAAGLGVLLKSAGFTNAGEEVYTAQDYIVSRDALAALNKNGAIARAYGNSSISFLDRYNPLGTSASFEDLYRYYEKKIVIQHAVSSSITTLTVRAYTAEDARAINEKLLEMAEATVNRLNERGRKDLIDFAKAEVRDAEEKAQSAAIALASYRNSRGVVDPEKQAAVQVEMISKLQDALITTRTELDQLRVIAPDNPQIPVLESRVAGLTQQINRELGKVAGAPNSLAAFAVQYQRLSLESQFADKQLASAMASLEEARNEARRKQAYVERIVQPNLPDEPLEPRRMRGILATFALGWVAWAILKMLFAGIKEHGE